MAQDTLSGKAHDIATYIKYVLGEQNLNRSSSGAYAVPCRGGCHEELLRASH